MKKLEKDSQTWTSFKNELEQKCHRVGIEPNECYKIRIWLEDSIKQINQKAFDYYIVSGPTSDKNLKIDLSILIGKRIYSLNITQGTAPPLIKTFAIFPLDKIISYTEEIEEGFLTCTFTITDEVFFYIEDSETNSAKLRVFAHKLLDVAWGKQ